MWLSTAQASFLTENGVNVPGPDQAQHLYSLSLKATLQHFHNYPISEVGYSNKREQSSVVAAASRQETGKLDVSLPYILEWTFKHCLSRFIVFHLHVRLQARRGSQIIIIDAF